MAPQLAGKARDELRKRDFKKFLIFLLFSFPSQRRGDAISMRRKSSQSGRRDSIAHPSSLFGQVSTSRWLARCQLPIHLAQLDYLPASQDVIAFNRREQLASLRPLVMGLQRSGTAVCAGPSVLEGKFSQAATLHYLRGV
jgi:hypothetical protein